MVFSPEGKHIASGNHAGKINIYAAEGGEHVTTLDTRGRFTYSIAYVSKKKHNCCVLKKSSPRLSLLGLKKSAVPGVHCS